MAALETYAGKYRNLKFERTDDGILTMTFHSDGGSLLWSAGAKDTIHADLPEAFYDISRDPKNRVIIMTGARTPDKRIAYPDSELARGHGAGTEKATDSAAEAYGAFPHWHPGRPGSWTKLPWA